MDKFVKEYWKRTWILNLFVTLMVLWGVYDTVSRKYSVWWMYFTLVIFVWFIWYVRNDIKKDYFQERKLLREGLIE